MAQALTAFNYEHGRQVRVNVHTVVQAIYSLRERLESQGIHTNRPAECYLIKELKRATGHRTLATDVHNAVPLRRLRVLDRIATGKPVRQDDRTKATNWEAEMKRRRHVVDITDDGVPYTRPAESWELDENGELRSLVTLPQPRQRRSA